MRDPVAIRVATAADWKQIHRVRMAVRENVLSDPSRVTQRDYEEMLGRDGRGWVHERDGRIVGFAIGDHARRNIWALFVEPGYEGLGIGRALHDAMVRWLFAQGDATVWLGTTPGTRAEGFYEAAGWRRKGMQPNGEVRFEMDARTAARLNRP